MKVLSVTVAALGLQESWREAEAQHHVPESALLKMPGEDIGRGGASDAVKTPSRWELTGLWDGHPGQQ